MSGDNGTDPRIVARKGRSKIKYGSWCIMGSILQPHTGLCITPEVKGIKAYSRRRSTGTTLATTSSRMDTSCPRTGIRTLRAARSARSKPRCHELQQFCRFPAMTRFANANESGGDSGRPVSFSMILCAYLPDTMHTTVEPYFLVSCFCGQQTKVDPRPHDIHSW